MVERESTDGNRIASLLAAELAGFEDPPFSAIEIDESPEVAVSPDESGERARSRDESPADSNGTEPAYRVAHDGEALFEVVAQPDRIYLEFGRLQAEIREAAETAGLRVRPKATRPPATLVFVERGADVKRVIDVLRECLLP